MLSYFEILIQKGNQVLVYKKFVCWFVAQGLGKSINVFGTFSNLTLIEVELTRYLGARTEWHIKVKSKDHQYIYDKW